MKQFELKTNFITMSVNGPKSLLKRRFTPFRKRINPTTTFLEFFSDELKVQLSLENADEYHIASSTGHKFPLTGTAKEFVEKTFKRPWPTYSIRIQKKKSSASGSRRTNATARTQIVNLEFENLLDKSELEQEDQIVDIADLKEQITGRVNPISFTDDIGGSSLLSASNAKATGGEQATPSNSHSHPVATSSSSLSFTSTADDRQSSAKREESARKNSKNIKREQNKKFINEEENESIILDLRAQGIGYQNVMPTVKKNLREISNETFLRAQEEIRQLKRTKRHAFAEPLWEKLFNKAPVSCRLLEKLLLKNFE